MEVAALGLGRWKTAFALALAAVVVVALYWLRTVILEVFLALLLGILLDGITWVGMRFLRLPRGGAVVLAAVVFVLGLLAALALILVPLVKEGTDLVQSMPQTIASIDRRVEEARHKFPWLNRVWPVNSAKAPAETAAKVPQLAKKALFTASAALEIGATALAVFFLGLFLAWDPERWLRGVAELWPGPWVEERVELFRKIGFGLRSYLFTLAIYIVTMGVAWSLGLWIIGIQYPLLFGAIGGLAEVVPYVGPMLGLVPPLLIAMTAGPVGASSFLVPLPLLSFSHLPPPTLWTWPAKISPLVAL